jgi:ATP-dependent DNA helicase RecG
MPFVQLKGKITKMEMVGAARKKRLVASLTDNTGTLELVWFQGINWTREKLKPGVEYVVFGKPNLFGRKISIAHPEVEPLSERNEAAGFLQPVYPLTEKLKAKYIDSKLLGKLAAAILKASVKQIRETLPEGLRKDHQLIGKAEAINQIHFPESHEMLAKAQKRLKFEELFYIQLRLLTLKLVREEKFKGLVFNNADLLTEFYNNYLPFELTNAQKKVIKEIYVDLKSGKQMNRLLQGDVGSGKTIVAFITMLIAIGAESQCALMAPTEILAIQHFNSIKVFADLMKIPIGLLTGSTKKSERNALHKALQTGYLKILIGTHALIEEEVQFQNLGLAVIDEQHRFGVAQRSKLWTKTKGIYPHVLVMTATPIPRTLAMTLYGDLDISVIDELPAGRKPIKTEHKFDSHRLQVNQFIKNQIGEGRQVYVVYPLIEESEKLDLKHLMDGYESIARAFPDVPRH